MPDMPRPADHAFYKDLFRGNIRNLHFFKIIAPRALSIGVYFFVLVLKGAREYQMSDFMVRCVPFVFPVPLFV